MTPFLLIIADTWAREEKNINPSYYQRVENFDIFKQLLFKQERYWLDQIHTAIQPALDSVRNLASSIKTNMLLDFTSEMRKQIFQITEPINESNRHLFAEIINTQINSLNSITQGLTQQLDVFKQFSEFTDYFSKNLTKTIFEPQKLRFRLFENLPDLSIWANAVTKMQEARENLSNTGFSFSAHLFEGGFLISLAGKPEETKAANITKKLITWTRKDEFASRLETAIDGSKFLRTRWKKIENGLLLHKRSDYSTAISVLLPQLEGIFTDVLIIRGQAVSKNGKLYAKGSDGNIKSDKRGKPLALTGWRSKIDHANFPGDTVLQSLTSLFLDTLLPKRNPILHGNRGNHESPKLSTQILLAILAVSEEIAKFEHGRKKRKVT
ncbi:MAG: hypothetical protein M1347_03525 [Chloroflexi bacterium]|nr:hypothetical protein [Chloroflexota bacterium]